MSLNTLDNQIKQLFKLVQTNQFNAAVKIADTLDSSKLNHIQVYHACAVAYLNTGNIIKAIDEFSGFLKLNPNHHGIHNVIADLYSKQHKFEQAEFHFNQAIRLEPNVFQYWFNWGLSKQIQKDVKGALDKFKKTVELNPDFKKGQLELATTLFNLDQTVAANEILIKLVSQHPQWKSCYLLGETYSKLAKPSEARNAFLKALSLAPNEYRNYEALCLLELNEQNTKEAQSWLFKGLKHLPENPELNLMLSNLKYELAESEPLEHYQKVLLKSDSDILKRDYISQAILVGKHELASSEIDGFYKTAKNKELPTALHCNLAIKNEQYEEVLSILPTDTNINLTLLPLRVVADFAVGNYQRANTDIDKLLEQAPGDQYYWALKSTALKQLDRGAYEELIDIESTVFYKQLMIGDKYDSLSEFNLKLRCALKEIHSTKVNPLSQSGKGGTQTPGYLFDQKIEIIQDLKSYLHTTCSEALRELKSHKNQHHPVIKRYKEQFEITTAWSMWLKDGGYHKSHCHSKGWYSSAYYVSVPKSIDGTSNNDGSIYFGKPGIKTKEKQKDDKVITPKEGFLAIFPSMLWHGTFPFSDSQPRVVVAFDLLPSR